MIFFLILLIFYCLESQVETDVYEFVDEIQDIVPYSNIRTYQKPQAKPETDLSFQDLILMEKSSFAGFSRNENAENNLNEIITAFTPEDWLKKDKAMKFLMTQNSKLSQRNYVLEKENKMKIEENIKLQSELEKNKKILENPLEYIDNLGKYKHFFC